MPDQAPDPLIDAFGYIRVSMKREEMISPETQKAAIEQCAARTGRRIVDWIEDLDRTGRNFKRKITAAIDRVKAGEAAEIIVWKFSRFGRDRHGNAIYLAELENAGGRLISATENVDETTATGKFTRGMLLEIGAFESDRAGETWAEAYGHRVQNGLPPLGRPRFGYRRLGRVPNEEDPDRTRHVPGEIERYVPDPDSGPVLASMFRDFTAGAGFGTIARRITEDGWRTSYGNPWRAQAVKDVLDSGFGAGFLLLHDPACKCKKKTACRRKKYVRGAHEPVISENEWEAYLARREQSRSMPPRARSPRYAVTAIPRCGHCRAAMVASGIGEGGDRVFSCSRQRHYGDCPGLPSVTVTRLTDAVKEDLAKWAADIDAAARADTARAGERRQARDAVSVLQADLEKKERELVNLALKQAADDVLPGEAWAAAAATKRAERDAAEAALQAARKREKVAAARVPPPSLNGILADWDSLPPAALNAILRSLLRRIVVTRTGKTRRDAAGHQLPVPVRIELHPVWEPDPWAGEGSEKEPVISAVAGSEEETQVRREGEPA